MTTFAETVPNVRLSGTRYVDAVLLALAVVVMPLEATFAQPLRPGMMAILAVYGVFHWREAFGLLRRRGTLVVLPAIILVSVLWAAEPAKALWFGILFSLTVGIGAVFGSRLGIRDLVLTILFVEIVSALVSLVFAVSGIGFANDAFIGMFGHKNLLGKHAVVMMLAALTVLTTAHYGRFDRIAAIGALVAAVSFIVLSRSALAQIVGIVVIVAIAFFYVRQRAMRAPRTLGAILIGSVTLVLASALIFTIGLRIDTFGELLGVVGRDTTLTGRTFLWRMGFDSFADHPVLGVGAASYWQMSNSVAVQFAQRFSLDGVGFSFHNSGVDILVHLGLIGLFAAGLTYGRMAGIVLGYVRRFRSDADPFVPIFVIAILLIAMGETTLFSPLQYLPLLLWVGIFCLAKETDRRPPGG